MCVPPTTDLQCQDLAFAELVGADLRGADLREANLTQASLIAYVAEFGATTQTRLADRLDIGRAAIGTVIDQLERRELVARHPNPTDRRVWLVDVTDTGRRLSAEIAKVDERLRGELRHGIGREERQALSWVLTRLQQNLQSAIADTSESSNSEPNQPDNSNSNH